MIAMNVRVQFKPKRLRKKTKQGNVRSLFRAASFIRVTARRSIRTRKKKTAPAGRPPFTRGKRRLKNAILFAVDRKRERALIGPDFQVVGPAGAIHEFGGQFRGERYDRRPFMGPALAKTKDKLPKMWAGSVR